jgi:hypothetical protein
MDNAYLIALIAAVLQVRNQVALNGCGDDLDARERTANMLGDPIQEARELLDSVINDQPELPEAPNTKGGGTNG